MNMQPEAKLISIQDNRAKIIEMLAELVLLPRVNALKWSAITKQTPNIKIGYPGQHLASLITGMAGERTGARGNDLIDGSEVKSCSRIDQLDSCKDCEASVARSEDVCSVCASTNIIRRDDSKWLFTIRNEADLKVLLEDVNRVVLLIGDYPSFIEGDYNTLRFQAFEIWTHSPRNKRFCELMSNYYQKIYSAHKAKRPDKTPAPKNFWPFSYQFYLCNPIPTFVCLVKNASTHPEINITYYVEPATDRTNLESARMPADLLTELEMNMILEKASKADIQRCLKKEINLAELSLEEKKQSFDFIDETLRNYLPLRDTDHISVAKTAYSRRTTTL